MKSLTFCTLGYCALLLTGSAAAQAPITFVNTPEAVRQYEVNTLEDLRTKCQIVKSSALYSREEVRTLVNGYVSIHERVNGTSQYSMFVFDQDKRTFTLVDGQRLSRGSRLILKLALPRDYARCRIVRDNEGGEFLEVVHREQNAPGDAQSMARLFADAVDLSGVKGTDASALQTLNALSFKDRMVSRGALLTDSLRHDAGIGVRERMDHTMRRVFER